jgi:hypothetical protein
MPRKIKDRTLESRTARLRLPIHTDPVFVRLRVGVFLGYRRNKLDGNWVVRAGKPYRTKNLGAVADDYHKENGRDVLDYWRAQERALKMASHNDETAAEDASQTVAQALDAYEASLKKNRRDPGNASRVRPHLPRPMLASPVATLGAGKLREWHDSLTETVAPATVKRIANAFRAALNLAADKDERIENRSAWTKGLKSLDDVHQARNVFLTAYEIYRIITAAYDDSVEFGLFVETAAITGARESQIARLLVADLQDGITPRLMMSPSNKGNRKTPPPPYPVAITPVLAARLRTAAAGRPLTAPLLVKPVYQPKGLPNGGRREIIWTPERIAQAEALAAPDADGNTRPHSEIAERLGVSENAITGLLWRRRQKQQPGAQRLPSRGTEPWGPSDHGRPFARVVAAAKVRPGEKVTIYALRHSSIQRQLLANIPISIVAAGHDTSDAIIRRNYARFIGNHADGLVRPVLLDTTTLPLPAEVIPLRERG